MRTKLNNESNYKSYTNDLLSFLLCILCLFLWLETTFAQSIDKSKVKNNKSNIKINYPKDSVFSDNIFQSVCGGVPDDFLCPAEPTVRDAALVSMLTTQYSTSPCFVFLDFDDIPWRISCRNVPLGFFVHKLSLPIGGLLSAVLTIKCKAASKNKTNNDYIAFFQGSTYITGSLLRNLPGTGGIWFHNQSATFTLNLSSLPTGFLTNNILPYAQDGDIDILVGTETGVDYMCLAIQRRWWDISVNLQAARFPDSLFLSIRGIVPPYPVLDSAIVFPTIVGSHLKGRLALANALPGNSYYAVIKHRNSIETWSANPIAIAADSTLADSTSYDFTTSVNQAYGSNMIIVGGLASIYSGDIDQDGIVDASDLSFIDTDGYNMVYGYVNSDLTGDNFVDVSDMAIVENNGYSLVSVVRP